MSFVVQRRQSTSESVTGMLQNGGGRFLAFTLEPPYAAPDIKPRCIPAGTYDLTVRYSPKFKRFTPHVENVPGFTEVEIHPGNYPQDTDACLLVGSTLDANFVGNSDATFDTLYQIIYEACQAGPTTITYIDPITPVPDVTGEL